MVSNSVEHKLKVFISSKCGGKYTVARKALKKLLEATGLVEAYVFETEPASSEDTRSSYLEFVDRSDLCIFLIDNKDGVPVAVQSELKRARDVQLRLLFLFCDETKREPTPLQEEIKRSLSEKYQIVHEFADIAPAAYDSVMQDIILIYRRKQIETVEEHVDSSESAPTIAISPDTYTLPKIVFQGFQYVSGQMTREVFPIEAKESQEVAPIDKLLSVQLKVVLYQRKYEETTIDAISEIALGECSGAINEVLALRFQAQKRFFQRDYSACIELLQQAIAIAIEKHEVPTWIYNDIAIDIRHVYGYVDELNNKFSFDNPGQKYIDDSKESVYFPFLDRQVENMQEEIVENYYSQQSVSPYSTRFGNFKQMFLSLANAFSIAEIHGSIVQTEIIRNRLISIYAMLCTLYDDHRFFVEYIRLLLVNRESKKLDAVIRTYHQSVDILNSQDLERILDSIGYINHPLHQTMSKYLLASRFGNLLSDTAFSALFSELHEHSTNWIDDKNKILNVYTYIFDFYRENIHRIDSKNTIDFISRLFERDMKRYFRDGFRVLSNIDYSRVQICDQERVLSILIQVFSNPDQQFLEGYYSALIRFCKATDLSIDELESILSEKHAAFYKDTYLLEMVFKRKGDIIEFIRQNAEEQRSKNATQGENGTFLAYPYENLDVIYNLLKGTEKQIDDNLLKYIIDLAIETLSMPKQSVRTKMAALKLLQYLFFQYRDRESIWNPIRAKMLENAAEFSTGSELGPFYKETDFVLVFQYNLFLCAFQDARQSFTLERLYSVGTEDSFTIIQLLKVIEDTLEDAGDLINQNESLQHAFLFFCAFMTNHKECDVKYQATKCLIALTGFELTKRLALMHLSQIMNSSSQAEKIAIITRVKRIKTEDDSYVEHIISMGKADSNFLVRYVAMREEDSQ